MSENKEPLVSIILPVYNGEKFLSVSIESCINQTYKNWELLIIDDGSSDSSELIARKYAAVDPRISYYKNSQNLRLPKTLNRGFSLAKGQYLTWTSDDNYYRSNAIGRMVSELNKTGTDFVFSACSIIDESGNRVSSITAPKDFRHAIWDYDFVGACFMYTRIVYETVGDYDPLLFLCEDYDYWLRIFAQFKVQYIDEDLYAYRRHVGALSQTHKYQQYEMVEKVLLKNFKKKKKVETLDRFYLYRGLHRSRSLQKSFIKKFKYFPKLLCYKIWHQLY